MKSCLEQQLITDDTLNKIDRGIKRAEIRAYDYSISAVKKYLHPVSTIESDNK